ncbi:response regulator transcription factor [Sedimentitalea sp. JM2-8]|uniref:Response regulator transcription factor n=1 Tax=Sedimentitalea xiamensis TaxID=3050037 RepID=A0ABT7FK69_9RHOB|nr:response regulator transcription factor [Sedimentitalea xiamensis]MDK3075318.1 response regulator transcription factor [Sedimentitalea xiamensis]
MGIMDRKDESIVIRTMLVIDDHPLYCDALVSTLSERCNVRCVRSATTLSDGLAALEDGDLPDLVLLDLNLPDVTGLSGFFRLKERLPDVPVLAISADSSDETIQMLMDAGAVGFVPKGASQEDFRMALQKVEEGSKFLPDGFRPRSSPESDKAVPLQDIAQRIADLTPQQSRIMGLICAGKPNKQIAYEMSLAEATVKAHITALLRRLGVRNRTQAAVLVNRVGFAAEQRLSEKDAKALLS